MTITTDEDDDRIDAAKRWHIFNRDPTSEHWQNIDSLLERLKVCDGRSYTDKEVDDMRDEHDSALERMESEHDGHITYINADHAREIEGYESHIAKLEEVNSTLRIDYDAMVCLSDHRYDMITIMERRMRCIEDIARRQAAFMQSKGMGAHVAALEAALTKLDAETSASQETVSATSAA
jgi:hypothetical protein